MIELNEMGPKYRLSNALNRLSPMTKNWSGGILTDASGGRLRDDGSKATWYDRSPICSRKIGLPSASRILPPLDCLTVNGKRLAGHFHFLSR
jgi:hypothetical protein